MAKKKVRKRITKPKALEVQEYWKMRFLAQLIETFQFKKMLAEKESVILNLRMAICADKLKEYSDDLGQVEKDYQQFKQELEVKHKVSLENVNIDETNFTIHGGIDGAS